MFDNRIEQLQELQDRLELAGFEVTRPFPGKLTLCIAVVGSYHSVKETLAQSGFEDVQVDGTAFNHIWAVQPKWGVDVEELP